MSGDSYTEVTSISWGQRLGQAIGGVILGILFFLVSFPVLFWNEGRAVQTARGLSEGEANVVSVPPDRVDAANEGKLVHTTGQATTPQKLTDPEFGVSAQAIRLERVVLMYQWRQKTDTKSQKKLGGGVEQTTVYNYEPEWASEPISSADFKIKEGHQNPPTKQFGNKTEKASPVQLGGFELSAPLADQISTSELLPVDAASLARLSPELRDAVKVLDGRYYIGKNPAAPVVGDLKVEFRVVKPTMVSVVAEQTNNTLRPYTPKTGNAISLLSVGTHSAQEMFKQAQSGNTMLTWILRMGGFLFMTIGIVLVFRPLVVVADVLPILGDFLSMGITLFAGLVAMPLTLITIAIGWIVYRPLLGAGLLAAALAGVVALFLLRRKRRLVVARAH